LVLILSSPPPFSYFLVACACLVGLVLASPPAAHPPRFDCAPSSLRLHPARRKISSCSRRRRTACRLSRCWTCPSATETTATLCSRYDATASHPGCMRSSAAKGRDCQSRVGVTHARAGGDDCVRARARGGGTPVRGSPRVLFPS